jgi:hypothetical protein
MNNVGRTTLRSLMARDCATNPRREEDRMPSMTARCESGSFAGHAIAPLLKQDRRAVATAKAEPKRPGRTDRWQSPGSRGKSLPNCASVTEPGLAVKSFTCTRQSGDSKKRLPPERKVICRSSGVATGRCCPCQEQAPYRPATEEHPPQPPRLRRRAAPPTSRAPAARAASEASPTRVRR